MKRVFWLSLILLLPGCVSRGDTLAPLIVISYPKAGAVRTAEGLVVRGFVMDNRGITALRVNGTDLLASPLYQAERGKQLIEFEFLAPSRGQGTRVFIIEAQDTHGYVSTLRYELLIDTTPPEVALKPLERLAGNRVRASGTARDNDKVAQIIVNGAPITFAPMRERSFSLDVAGPNVQVVVIDRAGNRIEVRP